MSFINNLDDKIDIFEPEVETSVTHDDVKKKFGLYRSNAEEVTRKYREAKNVIDRLKEEIRVSRDMEKSQRMRISSLTNRLSVLEENGKKLYEISERQRNNSEEILKLDSNIIGITNAVQQLKEKFQTVISSTIKEMNVIRENRDLQSVLEAKEVEFHKLKTELISVLSEKEDLVQKYEAENERLRKEVEALKSQENNAKDNYDNMINIHKQKILEYERIIETMEQERKSILGDYDIGDTLQGETNTAATGIHHNDKAVTWPDSTVTCLTDEREKTQSMEGDLTLRKRDQCHTYSESKSSLHPSQKTIQENRMTSQFSKFSFKQKPKLQFLDSTDEVSAVYSQPQPKKRLYSQNSNHYIN